MVPGSDIKLIRTDTTLWIWDEELVNFAQQLEHELEEPHHEDRACVEEVFFVGMEEADKEDSGVLATFIGQHESFQSFELLLWIVINTS